MNITESIIQSLPRKIICAAIAGSIFAVLFGAVQPNPFGEDISSARGYMEAFLIVIPVYLMFSFPVILIYGSLTSTLSDLLTLIILKNKKGKMAYCLTLFFHLVFGLVLLWISLLASLIYFLTDRFLSKKRSQYKWNEALKSLILPLLVWVLFMGIIWLRHFAENWTDYI